MRRLIISPFITAFVLAVHAAASLAAQSAGQNAADAERFIRALDLHTGSVVGEIGAGDGALTIAVARAVGEAGRVFSNELNPERLAGIGQAASAAGVQNVTPVEGRAAETNFADACCDAIFMRDVYHHFQDPAAMNASIFRSLKPGGRLAIIDFGPPPGAESATPAGRSVDGHHGITAPTLERELKAAGFEVLSSTELDRRLFMILARRPAQ
jgi:ubiquinone/menaquinone biosynthesis C-methylase UbiE